MYVLCNWGLRSKIKMGEKKTTSLHRYADLIQGWEGSWRRRWALPRRDQLWNDQQLRAEERQRRAWRMQHFQREKTSKATQLTFYGKSSIYSWRGKIFFCDLRWDVVENLNPSPRKETMNEEATMVQATQPPSGLPELIFRRFLFSLPNLTYVSRNTTWIAGKSQSSYLPLLLSQPPLTFFGEVILLQQRMDDKTFGRYLYCASGLWRS